MSASSRHAAAQAGVVFAKSLDSLEWCDQALAFKAWADRLVSHLSMLIANEPAALVYAKALLLDRFFSWLHHTTPGHHLHSGGRRHACLPRAFTLAYQAIFEIEAAQELRLPARLMPAAPHDPFDGVILGDVLADFFEDI